MRCKKTKLIFVLVLGSLLSFAQSPDITELEYYFDTDPGFGNGTAVSIVADSITNTTFNIDISGLSAGYHKVYFRTKDEDKNWSLIYVQNVVKVVEDPILLSTDIIAMEYFIDTDPGFGNGTPVAIADDIITETLFDIDISGLSPGFHKIYFRSKNENRIWSLAYVQNVVKVAEDPLAPLTDIVAMEYFFDTDPGFGSGTPVAITAGAVANTTFDIDISGLDAGYHKVYYRTMSEDDVWSLAYIHNIVKVVVDPAIVAPDLVEVEYFIDTDPGFGNGTAVAISPADTIVDFTFGVDVSSFIAGEYDLYVRLKNEDENWSLINIIPFEVTEVELTAMLEGPYNGVDMNTDLNSSVNLPLSQPFNIVPWNYSGTESVVSIPNTNIVDWVLLETRNADDPILATVSNSSSRFAAFILKDGTIVGLDGSSNLQFNANADTNHYLVIYHRNHLGVLTADELNYAGGIYNYDFTTSSEQAYNSGQHDLGSGVYGLIGGDANSDGFISELDLTEQWDLEAGESGYFNGDMNMDTQVDNEDKNLIWLNNLGSSSTIPE